jgi:hypothetical protein
VLTNQILTKLALDSANRAIIIEHIPDFEKSDSSGKEAPDADAKRRARERQAAILATFASQQKAFLKSTEEDKMETESKPSLDDFETISEGALCALCRSETPASEGRVLGYIGLVQTTKIPTIAKDQDVGIEPEKGRRSMSFEYKNRTEPKKPSFTLSESPTISQKQYMKGESKEEEEETEELMTITSIDDSVLFDDHPLNHNLDETVGVHAQVCGHCMHDDCYASFFASLINRHFQYLLQQRPSPTNVDKGEFFCPVCRRLSNALIPVLPKEYPRKEYNEILHVDTN